MRIKRGESKRARHKKLLKQTKGFRMSYSKLYRRAKEAVLHAGQYSYAHRRRRSSQMRQEWIKTISAALVNTDYTYSKFMNALKKSNVEIDRKNLAELAVYNPAHFAEVVKAL